MKTVFYYALALILLTSCRAERGTLISEIPEYINMEGYKSLYAVDTIKIENPVRFFTKKGYQFVMSQKAFQSYNGKEESLFERADAFLLQDGPPIGVSMDFYKSDFKGFSDCSECLVRLSDKKKGISQIYAYSSDPYFQLLLIRGDYYNKVYTGIDGPPLIKLDNSKFTYYKVAIPFCNVHSKSEDQ